MSNVSTPRRAEGAKSPVLKHDQTPLSDSLRPMRIGPAHPLRRGAFAAIIFCGDREVLGELAGEATAGTARKFVVSDHTLDAMTDFARSGGATLPVWSPPHMRPTPGACFVFTRADHPAAVALEEQGAAVVIAAGACDERDAEPFRVRLERFALALPASGHIALLGYGQQGRVIADLVRDELGIAAGRIVVCDTNAASRGLAERDGFVANTAELPDDCVGVIASPLRRYEAIQRIMDVARARSIPVLDNAHAVSGLQQWTRRGEVLLDEAASRALHVEGTRLSMRTNAIGPITVHIVREDVRVLASRSIRHLLGGQLQSLETGQEFDVAVRWPGDGHAADTWCGFRRAFITPGASGLGLFAARELCRDLWPGATQLVFPSNHVIDLGITEFERLLAAHLEGREIVTTMQTLAQRVVLGVAAAQHAADRPIIEIGSALGGSALHMAAVTLQHRPAIYSIDPDAPTREIMHQAFDRAGHADRLVQITRTSDRAIADLSTLRGRCGLVLIDGVHSAAAAARDFWNYAPLVAVGGALLFHDVCPAIHSVMQAVVEHVLPDQRFAARCIVDGLLVLERLPE